MRSMTGFSRASGENQRVRLEVSIRTVNHRHLDITVRLPEELREYESPVRKAVAERLTRGRAEIRIDVLYLGGEEPQIEVEEDVVAALRERIDGLVAKGLITAGLSFMDLMKLPGAVRIASSATEFGSEDARLLIETVGQAAEGVVAARQTEGGNLKLVLERLADELSAVITAVEESWGDVTGDLSDRLRGRVEELLEGMSTTLDDNRLAQEVAMLVERGDVREELDRLRSHLDHLRELVGQEGKAVGKRLDFLAQEIFRELSTLAAKFRDPGALQRVIDGKLVCEQIREQVQNIE